MNVGDTAEIGYWCRSEAEHPAAKRAMVGKLTHSAAEQNVRLGPPTFTRYEITDDRVDEPPAWCTGEDVHLLVAEAEVLSVIVVKNNSFVADLNFKDLQTLRAATRRAYFKSFGPQAETLTDDACDVAIEAMGPHIAEIMLREAIDATKH